ncbi:LOW QUALITY PROTEIN: syntaxin-11-like [Lethenteron reissneri]|uniref:LOW QUALITY PROTEIN: syntaxin-11-like n=1 Tax=Lethenteron reissneri TaxID=7753 RepID=UPI002AB6CB00|nr:LOW QUALITY PROTEIN: syntaxin-11-like [Lethenteron reissneri]
MKDRLQELITISHKTEDEKSVVDDEVDSRQESVIFEHESPIPALHEETEAIQDEIERLQSDVRRMGKQNARFLTSMRRLSSIKRDANAVARDVRLRAERLHKRLQLLTASCEQLEARQGAQSAAARIIRAHVNTLTQRFHQVMLEYNAAEIAQRENCKRRIARQLEILGSQPASDAELEERIEQGNWEVFAMGILGETRSAKAALNEIEQRHQELLKLEQRLREVHDLFLQMALLVEEQGEMVNNIENTVTNTQDYIAQANETFQKAIKYQNRNPFRKLLRCCCCCCYS